MTTQTSTFDPSQVTITITWNEISHVVSGFEEGTICTIEQNMPRYELYTGADNTNTRIYKNNTAATINIPLAQSSASNGIFTLLHRNDTASRTSDGLFQILIKDNSGRSFFSSSEAFIAQLPASTFGNSMNTREWQIQAIKCESYIDGNSKLDPADADTYTALGGTLEDYWRG